MASSLSRHTCLPQASVINSGSHFRPLAQQVVIHVEQGEDFSVAKAGLQRLDGAVRVVSIARCLSSRTIDWIHRKEARRTPRVTGVTQCRLLADRAPDAGGSFTRCWP